MSAEEYDIAKAAKTIGIDEDSMRMLVDMLANSLDDALEAIENAVMSGDFKSMHEQSHKLKGAAANLGFTALAEHCRAIESNAKNLAGIDYAEALDRLRTEAKTIKKLRTEMRK